MNRITLLGRVGKDPEVKEVGQNKVCKFSLATSESYKKDGEKVTETEWHNLVFWGKRCDVLKEWVHKGDQLLVQGKVKTRSYEDKEGVNHYITEVICDDFEFISSTKKDEKPEANDKWHGKKPVPSMSKAEDLPGNVADYDNIPEDTDSPF